MKTRFLCIWKANGFRTVWIGMAGWRWWGFYWGPDGISMRRYIVLPSNVVPLRRAL